MYIFKNIIKSVKNPKKAIGFIKFMLKYQLRKKKGVLIFLGADPDGTFNLMYNGFEKCYVFEANPDRYKQLQIKYKNYSNIFLYNLALTDYNGEIKFNISNNNNGASSSIGEFDKNWQEKYGSKKIEMVKTITVPCVNLFSFIKQKNISFIDEYVSDIQGMDLTVLKTIKPLIDNKMVGSITCEVTKDKYVYSDLSDNSEDGFDNLLNHNYVLIAKGWGVLEDNVINDIPEDSWEMDCKWVVK